MATSTALRRAPCAAAAAARGLLGASCGLRIPPPHRLPYRAERSALLSSLSARQPGAAADAHLRRVLNHEISCARRDCKMTNWAKEKIREQFPFKIQDKKGTTRIILTRRDQKERIEVEVFLPRPSDPVEHNGEQKDDAEDDKIQAHAINRPASWPYVPLVVKIHKGMASWLEISCRSYLRELVIESLTFGPTDESVDSSNVEARICNLPKELQQAFYAYLRSRAISSDVTDLAHAYMINKESHEYIAWLRKLKALVKSK